MSVQPEAKCPLCRRAAAPEHEPFCSVRCRDRDLLNWLGGAYVVPGEPVDETALDKE